MLSRISDAPAPGQKDESSPKVFVDSVMERIGRESSIPPRRSARRPLAFAVGLALPLVLVGAWTIDRMNQAGEATSGATASSPARAAPVDIALFVRRDGRSLPAEGTSLRPTDELLIRYDNPGPQPRYFVALTLDAEETRDGSTHRRRLGWRNRERSRFAANRRGKSWTSFCRSVPRAARFG